MQKYFD